MSLISRLLFSYWPLKVTALGLAVVLYMGVAISESTRTFEGPIPIEVLNAPSGGALLDDPGVVESIEYRASDEVAEALTRDSFRASIDLSSVQPRPGANTVAVPVDVFPVDPRVRVVDYEPQGRTVRVDAVISRLLPVEVEHGPLPEGIELGPITVEPNQATVSGASSRLQNVRSVEGRFVVDASGINIDVNVPLEAFDADGAIVPGVDVQPSTARVRSDVGYQLAYATLPVIPQLVGEPARGRRVDNVSVLPATVTVSGESPDVRGLDRIDTAPVDISEQEVELVAEVPLELSEELTATGEGLVTVIVTFTEALGSRSYEIGTAITGAQPGFTYQLEEPSVSVTLSGSVQQLDELTPDEVSVEVPVDELVVGDNAVMPIVRTPRGTALVRVDPPTLRVTVGQAQ
ncbi:MAG: CdaR family protein [Candidatus Limnocylindrales bacterium]